MLFLSFSMVLLHADSMQKSMGVTPADVESMRLQLQSKFYSVLDLKRTESSAEMCLERKGAAVEIAQKRHYETVSVLRADSLLNS